MNVPGTVAALFVLGLAAENVLGQAPSSSPRQAGETLVFQMATTKLPPGRVRLANGIFVDRRDWPTLILASIDRSSAKPQTCTAVLVGPNTVLMAAHCVDNGVSQPRRSQLWVDARRIDMACEIHPRYLEKAMRDGGAPRASEDYAICLLDDGGKQPASFAKVSFDVIDTRNALATGERVLMIGYGCSVLTLADNGEIDWTPEIGTLRIGDEAIETAAGRWNSDPAYVTVRSNKGREPALCPGDSGGPLFSGVSAAKPGGERRIRGVNSSVCSSRRGDDAMCAAAYGPGEWDVVSAISATQFPAFSEWILGWIARNADKKPVVCGINSAAGSSPCRD